MKNKFKNYINIIFLILCSLNLKAQNSSSSAVQAQGQSVVKNPTSSNSKINIQSVFGIEYSQSVLDENNSSDKSQTLSFMLNPTLKINNRLSVATLLTADQSMVAEKDTQFGNIPLQLIVKGIEYKSILTTVHSAVIVKPINEAQVKTDRLLTSFGLVNKITFKQDLFDISYKLGLMKNVHEFTHNADGKANIEYIITQGLEGNLNLSDSWSLSATGAMKKGKTYGGFDRDSFEFNADINYQITEKIATNIGTTNQGSALKANGQDSNLSVFDENSSVYRAGLNIIF